jgi:hypothetical protein
MADKVDDVKLAGQPPAADPNAAPSPAPDDAPAEPTPDQSTPDDSGSTPAPDGETAAPKGEDEQPVAKAKPHRAPGAERRISELTAKTKALQAQLRDALAAQGQPAQPTAAPKPEETEEFWTQKYQTAQTDAERQQAQSKWQEAHDNKLVNRAKQEVLGQFQQQQVATRLSEKLARLHERQPFLQDGGKIDVNSPLVIRAAELAAESGVSIAGPQGINYAAFLYYATEAALDMQGQTVQSTEAKLATQKAATAKAIARTQLETSSTQAAPKPSGKLADLDKELNALEERRRKGGPTFHDPDLNRQILVLRQRRAQAVASAKT